MRQSVKANELVLDNFTAQVSSPGRRNLGVASLNCADLTQILSTQNDDSNIGIENQQQSSNKSKASPPSLVKNGEHQQKQYHHNELVDSQLHAGEYEIIMSSANNIKQGGRASRASGTLSQNSNPVKVGSKRHGSLDIIAGDELLLHKKDKQGVVTQSKAATRTTMLDINVSSQDVIISGSAATHKHKLTNDN